MLEQGLEEEVRSLYEKYKKITNTKTIGYKELFWYFEGKITKKK